MHKHELIKASWIENFNLSFVGFGICQESLFHICDADPRQVVIEPRN